MWILKSSVGRKVVMSLSGLFLITFLAIHLVANLTLLAGWGGSVEGTIYNQVCHFMDTNPLITVMVPVLAAGFAIHILMAGLLQMQNRKARGNDRYEIASKSNIRWESKNMMVLGIIVLGFLVIHLMHFWAKMQLQHFTGGEAEADAFMLAQELFTQPAYAAMYVIWVAALWFHLNHGFWSALQSVGMNNYNWMPRWKCLGLIISTLLCVGYAIIPLAFLFGCVTLK